jgi:hypothetical protein
MQPTLLGALNSRGRGARQTAVDRSLRRRGAAPNRGSSPGSVARRGLLLWWTSGVLDLRRPVASLCCCKFAAAQVPGGDELCGCRSDTLAADRRECSSHGEAAPFYARSRRESPPPTAPSTNPISGARGRSVIKPMTMPSARRVTAPTAIAGPMLVPASLCRAVVAGAAGVRVCGALRGSRLSGTEPVTLGAS